MQLCLSVLGPGPSVVLKSLCPFLSKLQQVLEEGGWGEAPWGWGWAWECAGQAGG